jgi:hypothetical protein
LGQLTPPAAPCHPHFLLPELQLQGESLSRLNACNTTVGWRRFDHRWVARMEGRELREHHWRKSWQVRSTRLLC